MTPFISFFGLLGHERYVERYVEVEDINYAGASEPGVRPSKFQSAVMKPRWPRETDGVPGIIDEFQASHGQWPPKDPTPIEIREENYHPECGDQAWHSAVFQGPSTSQWASCTMWMGTTDGRSRGLNYGEGHDRSFYGGLQFFQKGEMLRAIKVWEKVRGHLTRERSIHSPWHSRAMAILCSHIAMALGAHLDKEPQRTRGAEPASINQAELRPDAKPNRAPSRGLFNRALEYHLEHSTVNTGKKRNEPPQKEGGPKKNPGKDIAVTLMPSPVVVKASGGARAESSMLKQGRLQPGGATEPLTGMAVEERNATLKVIGRNLMTVYL